MGKEIKELQDKLDALKLKHEQSKQPFKNGDVIEKEDGTIILITDYKNGKAYGFNTNKNWCNESVNWSFTYRPEKWTLATSEEWLEALTKEAVKRYKIGDKIKTPLNNVTGIIDGNHKEFDLTSNGYFYHHNMIVFYKGIWAEVIKEVIKEETLEELAKRFTEYTGNSRDNFNNDFVTFFTENKETINRLSK